MEETMDTPHISRENMITFLLTTPMFEDLSPGEISEIIHIVQIVGFMAGETIFSEGEAGDAWYALYSGEVTVLKQSESGEKSIKLLGPHTCFGEIAVLDGLPRSATIRATKESVALRIPLDKFRDLLDKDHLVAYKLVNHMALMLASRQRASTEALSRLLLANELANIHEGIREIVGESSFRE
jgi:CRP-like cAMP-binding protein